MNLKIRFLLLRLARKTWVRCTLFSAFAVLAVAMAIVIGPWIPSDLAKRLGSDATESVLQILASSMLTVAIFSATTMVSAFSAVGSSATPRAAPLLIEDSTIQNTLATFIGAFLYSLIALVGLNAQVYGDGGRLVLFGFTIVLLVFVVVVLLRWIDYLSSLGRMSETIRRVERATIGAIEQHLPNLGATPQAPGLRGPHEVHAGGTGFIQYVAMDALQAQAGKLGSTLHLHVLPGQFVEPTMVIASTQAPLDDAARTAVQDAVMAGASRTFDDDPRYGMVVLGEIAARALSPAVNDPGTALDVLASGVRIVSHWRRIQREAGVTSIAWPDVSAPAMSHEGFLRDLAEPIAQYGASSLRVSEALLRALGTAVRLGGADMQEPAHRLASKVLAWADLAQQPASERAALLDVARETGLYPACLAPTSD
ncbi:DUF2254 domain-containing protein [Variovorax dokdonensis]|uniref:DUF2254 domain-containing protein n=1 Tax=Variovorax dokdonensis TaxID=344883 RepID=A0ABT7N7P6_9BURK|nr:DUF2254 domain-containing protein [Variovorax dokdonensis]MDM0043957.1 DUF2254 domain-containing protein [Variovorax dokdonensis]